MQIKTTQSVSSALCFISLLLPASLALAQSGGAAPEGQPREESTPGAGPTSTESVSPAPSPEPAPALAPLPPPVLVVASPIPPAPPGPPPVTSKFSATFYGFVEADFIRDSTQSFSDQAANALIGHNEKLFDKKLWSDLGTRLSRWHPGQVKATPISVSATDSFVEQCSHLKRISLMLWPLSSMDMTGYPNHGE